MHCRRQLFRQWSWIRQAWSLRTVLPIHWKNQSRHPMLPTKRWHGPVPNKKVAAVSSGGKITAKGVGKATITAKTSNGKKAVCKVTVRPRTNKIKKLKKSGRKSIKVTWSKVSGTTKYQIYMSKKKSSGYKRVKTASAKTFSFTKKGLKRGKRYYFKIRSYKTVGKTKYYSSYSPIKSIKR